MNAKAWEWSSAVEVPVAPAWARGKAAHRVRYREQGSRRWFTFLLVTDTAAAPAEAMVLRAIEEHAAQAHGGVR